MYVYLPKFNKQMHYYDTYPSYNGDFFTAILLFVLGLNMTPIGNNVSPSFISSTSPYIKIRRKNWKAPFKIQKFAPFSLVSLIIHPRSGRGAADKAGRGVLQPPPEDAARTKRFDRELLLRESHTEAETKKTPDRTPPKKNDNRYIYIFCPPTI